MINEAGNVIGLMPHPEHAVDPLTGSVDGLALFELARLACVAGLARHASAEACGRMRRASDTCSPWRTRRSPAGFTPARPDLVGVGAQRAGTTWWWRGAIRSHPGFVRESKPGKEIHFFDRFWDGREIPADLAEQYARQFPRPEGAITGEWTPALHARLLGAAAAAKAAPQTKILVMLRDPVERYRSGIAREQRLADEDGAPLEIAIVGDAVYRSMYAQQLRAPVRAVLARAGAGAPVRALLGRPAGRDAAHPALPRASSR